MTAMVAATEATSKDCGSCSASDDKRETVAAWVAVIAIRAAKAREVLDMA